MNKLTISIVLYSSDLELLEKVINSVSRACLKLSDDLNFTCKLDLVNNNQDDKNNKVLDRIISSKKTDFLRICLVNSPKNGGYGYGNNLSIFKNLTSDFHLVLNPDVVIFNDSLVNGIRYLYSNLDVGLVTPKVFGEDGELHKLCKRNPTLLDMFLRSMRSKLLDRIFSKRNILYAMEDCDYSQIIKPVPYPTGCFMLFRSSTLKLVGGFDDGYFLHYEDADIGRKLSQISQVAYVPNVVVTHIWGRETHKSWKMRWVTIKSGLRYWRKWGGVF